MIETDHYRINFTHSELTDKMREDIETFKKRFELKYNITPYISINHKRNFVGEISLTELFNIINQYMKTHNQEKFELGILQPTRKRPVVLFRHIFCKIATSLGYGPTVISNYINKNHATVIHSVTSVNNLLETGDTYTMQSVNDIYMEMEKYLSKREYEKIV